MLVLVAACAETTLGFTDEELRSPEFKNCLLVMMEMANALDTHSHEYEWTDSVGDGSGGRTRRMTGETAWATSPDWFYKEARVLDGQNPSHSNE